MKVPEYESGVRPAPLQTPYLRTPSQPANNGLAMQMGLRSAAATIARVVEKEKVKTERTVLSDAESELIGWENDSVHGPEGVLAKRKRYDALGVTTDTLDEFDKKSEDILTGVPGDDIREIARQAFQRRRDSLDRTLNVYERDELDKYGTESFKANIQLRHSNAIAKASDPEGLRTDLEQGSEHISAHGEANDWSADEKELADKSWRSNVVLDAVRTLLNDGLVTRAKQLHEDFSDDILPGEGAEIVQALEAETEKNRAFQLVDKVIGDADKPTAGLITALNNASNDIEDSSLRDAFDSEKRRRLTQLGVQNKQRNTEIFDHAWLALESAGDMSGVDRVHYLELDNQQRSALLARERSLKTNAPRPTKPLWVLDNWFSKSPEQRAVMDLREAYEYVSDDYFDFLMRQQDQIRTALSKGGAGRAAPVFTFEKTFDLALLGSQWVNSKGKPKNKKTAGRVAAAKLEGALEVSRLQQITGGKVTDEQTQAIVDRLVIGVGVENTGWNDPEIPFGGATQEEIDDESVYVLEDDIPKHHHDAIKNLLISDGVKPDEINIGRAYYDYLTGRSSSLDLVIQDADERKTGGKAPAKTTTQDLPPEEISEEHRAEIKAQLQAEGVEPTEERIQKIYHARVEAILQEHGIR